MGETCRSFYDAITKRILIKGKPTIFLVHEIQAMRLRFIVDELPEHRLRGDHIYIIIGLIGEFWKNPYVLNDYYVIEDLLGALPKLSVTMMIPHLEKWVLQHVEQNEAARTICLPIDVEDEEGFGSIGEIYLRTGRCCYTQGD
jgi:hypothetical protein